ncbi:diguanylate cyclase [Photobacterium sp. GJ3]|uniref:GGDEF domain-containing protein n=1 Tax=Photobacterium sp. GJ3 TaxID=2829502 RepID=UPI001B8AAC8F|nr:GGDEF domain-containing protein [Photobacterium sp. GJ3]QUJ68283.1 diguanylate cyclase [Photobacterium sp. GJ3]
MSCTIFVRQPHGWQQLNTHSPNQALLEQLSHLTLETHAPHWDPSGSSTSLWLPLIEQTQWAGLLVLESASKANPLQPDYFAPLTAHLSHELARHQASLPPEHTQRPLLDMLQGLHEFSFMLWRASTLDELLFKAVDQGKKVMQIDRIAIFLLAGDNKMKGTYGTDIDGHTVNEREFEALIPPLWFTEHPQAQNGYLAINHRTQLYHNLEPVGEGWSAYTSLWDNEQRVGWIAYDNLIHGAPLAEYHAQLLKQFSFIVSQHLVRRQAEEKLSQLNTELEKRVTERTLELQQLNRQLEHTSRQDPLTQVPNRRVFDQTLPLEWRRAKRHKLPLSLLMIDVDHFKHFNDRYGHAVGDQCLKRLAQALSSLERRAGALFARYGGEEFVILLPGQNAQAAVVTAENALHAVRVLGVPTHEKPTDGITVSIGVATLIPDAENSAEQLFNLADNALYHAKALGRNQYFMAD